MRKRVIFILICLISFLSTATKVKAVSDCGFSHDPNPAIVGVDKLKLKFDGNIVAQELRKISPVGELKFSFPGVICAGNPPIKSISDPDDIEGLRSSIVQYELLSSSWCHHDSLLNFSPTGKPHLVEIVLFRPNGEKPAICAASYYILGPPTPTPTPIPDFICKVEAKYSNKGDTTDDSWRIVVSEITFPSEYNKLEINIDGQGFCRNKDPDVTMSLTEPGLPSKLRDAGTHKVNVYAARYYSHLDPCLKGPQCGYTEYNVAEIGATPLPTPTPIPICTKECIEKLDGDQADFACLDPECRENCPDCSILCPRGCFDFDNNEIMCFKRGCEESCLACGAVPATPTPSIPMPDIESLCKKATDLGKDDCLHCLRGESPYDRPGLWTAIGCVPIDFAGFINEYVFTFGVGIAGGIAFLYFIYGCFLVLTSTGNPEKIAQAKQIILSALSGLLFIIFSVFILRIIGVDILGLPEFG